MSFRTSWVLHNLVHRHIVFQTYSVYLSFARSANEPSRVSITIRSPVLQNNGTFASKPVSSVAGFVDLPLVSPLIPGSQYVIVRVTLTGSLTPTGFPS